MIRRFRAAALGFLCMVLVACGGGSSSDSGGGDGGGPPPPPPPPPPPVTRTEALRFLNQASFGAVDSEAQRVVELGDSSNAYSRWIDDQVRQTLSLQLPAVQAAYSLIENPGNNLNGLHADRQESWLANAMTGPDQLRQRLAFALSEIMVVSQQGALANMPFATADYHDTLARGAFGEFRTLIENVTLHPAMGVYLSMLGNRKPNTTANIRPDENFARETMQLFSIGLVQLNLDGTVKTDAQGQPIPTYDQETIEGFAQVFTGWNYAGGESFRQARRTLQSQVLPMQAYAEEHDTGAKKLLSYPGAAKPTLPAGQSPQQDLADALDNIANHPNVGPFIGRQLIQKFVTSNPSPAYVGRVARVFNDDGSGRRGNLHAVIKAVLLDAEARPVTPTPYSSKAKEPLLRLTQLWRAYAAKSASGRYRLTTLSTVFGQAPLASPSVFNFFSPFYAPPGEIADQGYVAPELQISTEYQNTQIANFFYQQVFIRNSAGTSFGENVVVIDIAEEIALAADSEALVNRIAAKLLNGQISDALKLEAKAAVERIATTQPAQRRVAEALYLIVTSPEFVLQR